MNDDNSQARLDIVYDGPALSDGSMNVRDLAPAMLAIGGFFDAANRVTNGERAKVNVNVRATSASSFHILFEVAQSLEATDVLKADISDFLTTAKDLKDLLIGGSVGGGIIWLIKLLRGRKYQVEKINEDLYKLTVNDETYEVSMQLLRVCQDVETRRNIQYMVRPVKEPGIDRFMLRESDQVVQEVTKDDVDAFDVPEHEELILDEVSRHAFSIVSLVFKENNKWRLTDGANTYSVLMKDEAFQQMVDTNSVAFAKGDVLVCDLRTIQWQVEAGVGVKTEYEVTKVVQHRTARQLSFLDEAS